MKSLPRDFGFNGQFLLSNDFNFNVGEWIDFYNLRGEKLYGQIVSADFEACVATINCKGTLHSLELV